MTIDGQAAATGYRCRSDLAAVGGNIGQRLDEIQLRLIGGIEVDGHTHCAPGRDRRIDGQTVARHQLQAAALDRKRPIDRQCRDGRQRDRRAARDHRGYIEGQSGAGRQGQGGRRRQGGIDRQLAGNGDAEPGTDGNRFADVEVAGSRDRERAAGNRRGIKGQPVKGGKIDAPPGAGGQRAARCQCPAAGQSQQGAIAAIHGFFHAERPAGNQAQAGAVASGQGFLGRQQAAGRQAQRGIIADGKRRIDRQVLAGHQAHGGTGAHRDPLVQRNAGAREQGQQTAIADRKRGIERNAIAGIGGNTKAMAGGNRLRHIVVEAGSAAYVTDIITGDGKGRHRLCVAGSGSRGAGQIGGCIRQGAGTGGRRLDGEEAVQQVEIDRGRRTGDHRGCRIAGVIIGEDIGIARQLVGRDQDIEIAPGMDDTGADVDTIGNDIDALAGNRVGVADRAGDGLGPAGEEAGQIGEKAAVRRPDGGREIGRQNAVLKGRPGNPCDPGVLADGINTGKRAKVVNDIGIGDRGRSVSAAADVQAASEEAGKRCRLHRTGDIDFTDGPADGVTDKATGITAEAVADIAGGKALTDRSLRQQTDQAARVIGIAGHAAGGIAAGNRAGNEAGETASDPARAGDRAEGIGIADRRARIEIADKPADIVTAFARHAQVDGGIGRADLGRIGNRPDQAADGTAPCAAGSGGDTARRIGIMDYRCRADGAGQGTAGRIAGNIDIGQAKVAHHGRVEATGISHQTGNPGALDRQIVDDMAGAEEIAAEVQVDRCPGKDQAGGIQVAGQGIIPACAGAELGDGRTGDAVDRIDRVKLGHIVDQLVTDTVQAENAGIGRRCRGNGTAIGRDKIHPAVQAQVTGRRTVEFERDIDIAPGRDRGVDGQGAAGRQVQVPDLTDRARDRDRCRHRERRIGAGRDRETGAQVDGRIHRERRTNGLHHRIGIASRRDTVARSGIIARMHKGAIDDRSTDRLIVGGGRHPLQSVNDEVNRVQALSGDDIHHTGGIADNQILAAHRQTVRRDRDIIVAGPAGGAIAQRITVGHDPDTGADSGGPAFGERIGSLHDDRRRRIETGQIGVEPRAAPPGPGREAERGQIAIGQIRR